MPSRISRCASPASPQRSTFTHLPGLEILVVLEEVLDLLQRDVGQVGVVLHLVVALGQLRRGHRDDLLVAAGLVLHQEHADRAHVHDGAGHDRAGVGDQHVAGIAVVRQRVRDEAVIAGVAHRRIEEAVDHQRAGLLVHLVFDRLAANRHLDDDVDVIRRVVSDRNRVDAHENSAVRKWGWLSYAGSCRVSIALANVALENVGTPGQARRCRLG